MIRRLALILLLSVATPACAGVLSALPIVSRIVIDAMAVLAGINNAVQEIFRTRPDIPLEKRRAYTALFDKTMATLRALHKAAEGGQTLEAGDVKGAFDSFEAAYTELRDYLFTQKWMREDGALIIDGQVIGNAPPAAELRR